MSTAYDQIKIHLPPEEANAIREWAKREGVSVSELGRRTMNSARAGSDKARLAEAAGVPAEIAAAIKQAVKQMLPELRRDIHDAIADRVYRDFRADLQKMSDRFAALIVKVGILAGTAMYLLRDQLAYIRLVADATVQTMDPKEADAVGLKLRESVDNQDYPAARRRAIEDIKVPEREAIGRG